MLAVTRSMRLTRAAAALAALTLALGTGAAVAQSPAPMSSMATAGPLFVTDAWARTSPMVQMAGAAYMVIHNDGATDDALVGVGSPVSATVETHETKDDGSGQMVMAPVASIPVPAGGSVELKPGSYHIMLIDLVAPLEAGQMVPLTLTFQSGATLEVSAEVRDSAPMGSMAPMPMGSAAPMGAMPSASPAM
jgi:periplasmic copper chaperone A